jgi:hypothetical protein
MIPVVLRKNRSFIVVEKLSLHTPKMPPKDLYETAGKPTFTPREQSLKPFRNGRDPVQCLSNSGKE